MILSRRQLLATGGSIALSGCLGGMLPGSGRTSVDGPVANAPIPDSPSKFTYATMGSGSRPTVTYYGNWKCPYCAEFSTGFLKDLVKDYVEPGDINVQFRGLAYINGQPFLGPDAPQAARAGLAVWNTVPDVYWTYHEYVMANQPPEQKQWATIEKLVSFAKQAGIKNPDTIREKLNAGSYQRPIRATTQAAAKANVSGTPALVIAGETVNPLSKKERTRSLIERLINES